MRFAQPRFWLGACLVALTSACGLDVLGSGAVPTSDAGSSDAAVADAGRLDDTAAAETSSNGDASGDGASSDGAPSDGASTLATLVLTASPLSTPPTTSNLTADGTVDWAHWGYPGQVIRKATGGGVIGNYVRTATGGQVVDYDFAGWPIATSWSDGPAGNPSAMNTKTHQYFVYSPDVALTLMLPASLASRTAILYLGGYGARGRLELSFDDQPSKITSDERENQTYYYATRYEVQYSGSSASTKLVVRWKMVATYLSTGTIILSSIALR